HASDVARRGRSHGGPLRRARARREEGVTPRDLATVPAVCSGALCAGQGRQQNVVGVVGVAAPVGPTGLAAHEPFCAVTTKRRSTGWSTTSQEKGGPYRVGGPGQ